MTIAHSYGTYEWQWQFLLGKSSTNRPLSIAMSDFQTVGPFMSCFISICPRSMLRLSQATSEACPHQLMPDEWGKSSHCCSWTNVVEISWACWCSWIHSPASFVKKTSKGWSRNLSSPTQEQYLPTPLLGGSCPMLLVDVQGSQTLSNFITIHLARPSLYLYREIGKNTHSFGCFFSNSYGYFEGLSGFSEKSRRTFKNVSTFWFRYTVDLLRASCRLSMLWTVATLCWLCSEPREGWELEDKYDCRVSWETSAWGSWLKHGETSGFWQVSLPKILGNPMDQKDCWGVGDGYRHQMGM